MIMGTTRLGSPTPSRQPWAVDTEDELVKNQHVRQLSSSFKCMSFSEEDACEAQVLHIALTSRLLKQT
jgi:hypothetical protein